MDVNVTANYRLLRSLDPLLRRSDAGRAVFVTSGAAAAAEAYWGPYPVSKAALEMLVKTYAAAITNTAVKATLLSTCQHLTMMPAAPFPAEVPLTLRTPDH